MNQLFGVCNLSLVPLRAEASDRSEMLSQLLFGDHFEILETTEKWIRIRTFYDDYEGWIDPKQCVIADEQTFTELNSPAPMLGLEVSHRVQNLANGEYLNLVAGSFLPNYQDGETRIGATSYSLAAGSVSTDKRCFETEVISTARFYLNSPYLWGGRSVFGIDCSGFSQMVFRQFGIRLKRDAWQQAEQGELVDFLQEAKAGDLAFFDNSEGRIIHVGIMLNNTQIIHASGRVKIDTIDTEGIYSDELKRYTHKLRIIKRFRPYIFI